MTIFDDEYPSLELTEILFNAIKGFSISRLYESVLDNMEFTNMPQYITSEFLPHLFQFLQASVRSAILLK